MRRRAGIMESVLESQGPRELLGLSIVRIGLESTELGVDDGIQIETVVGLVEAVSGEDDR